MQPASGTEILIIGLLFMTVVFGIAYIRNLESRRVRKKFSENQILMSAFNVQYYGLESEPGGLLRSTGVLVLTSEGIYYRAKFLKRELFIPASSLVSMTAADTFKGKPTYVPIVTLLFVNEQGIRDRVGLRIPYPERWYQAILRIISSDDPK